MTTVEWVSLTGTGYPDQQADFDGPYWAQCGPESDGRWSWVVFDYDQDNAEIASGFAATEAEAKVAAEGAVK